MTSCDRYDCRDRELQLERVQDELDRLEAVVWQHAHGADDDVAERWLRGWLDEAVADDPRLERRYEARWLRLMADALDALDDPELVPEAEL